MRKLLLAGCVLALSGCCGDCTPAEQAAFNDRLAAGLMAVSAGIQAGTPEYTPTYNYVEPAAIYTPAPVYTPMMPLTNQFVPQPQPTQEDIRVRDAHILYGQ